MIMRRKQHRRKRKTASDFSKAAFSGTKSKAVVIEDEAHTGQQDERQPNQQRRMRALAAVNEAYGKFFPQNPPARACVQVAKLPRDAKVEIEAIAVKG